MSGSCAALGCLGPVLTCADDAPGRPGVAVLHGDDGEVVLVASTGDLRAFIARRSEGGRVAARVAVCGGAFEADCLQLEIAREIMPECCAAIADRQRGWFVHLDPDAAAPSWRKTDLRDVRWGPGVAETLIGPFANKHAAARAGEALDDAFDLCREPRRLALAPRAEACAYKEMGRCPAPCDGSEPMEAFRARVRTVLALAALGLTGLGESIGRDVAARAAALDFEAAAALQRRAGALEAFSRPGLRHARTLGQFGVLAVQPSGRSGWARVMVHAGGATRWWGDVASRDEAAVIGACRGALAWAEGAARAIVLSGRGVERVGVVVTHLYAPGRGRGTVMALEPTPDEAALLRAARRAGKIDATGPRPTAEPDGEGVA